MIKLWHPTREQLGLKILQGRGFDKDLDRVIKLPTAEGIWIEKGGSDIFSHYLLPREDLRDVLKEWQGREIITTKSVDRDIKLYRRLLKGIDRSASIEGKIKTFYKLFQHQSAWVRLDPKIRRLFNNKPTGSGKTMMSLERIKILGFKRALIITTNTILDDWVREIEKITGETPLVYVGSVTARQNKLRERMPDVRYVVSTYGVAHELKGTWFDAFIFDEQDLLANPETKRCQQLMPLLEDTWHSSKNQVVVQTATLTGNTPSTAYIAFWLIHPLLSGSYESFRYLFEKLVTFEEKSFPQKCTDGAVRWRTVRVEKKVRFTNKSDLVRMFNNYSDDTPVQFPFVHKKSSVEVEMTKDQKAVYEELRDELSAYVGSRKITIKQLRNKTMRLRQAAEGLFNFSDEVLESGKVDWLRRHLKRTDQKTLIWSPFRPMSDLLASLLPDEVTVFNGGLNREQKKLNRYFFNGCPDNELGEYERLIEKLKPAKIWKPGECPHIAGTMHSMTSRGANFQTGTAAVITCITFSGYTLVQTIGRHARMDQKAKKIWTYSLHSQGTNEDKLQRFILDRLNNMSLTDDDDETKISFDDAKKIAKLLIED